MTKLEKMFENGRNGIDDIDGKKFDQITSCIDETGLNTELDCFLVGLGFELWVNWNDYREKRDALKELHYSDFALDEGELSLCTLIWYYWQRIVNRLYAWQMA